MKTELRKIPYVGEATEKALISLGYTTIAALKGQNPEEMYEREMRMKGCHIDKCQLYMYRLVVYYAENKNHELEKLKWWYWKNEK
ncbi:MAG: hypothetical protein K0S71_1078 [Clostridia bacterium]|jgi:nucleotidyltransferase/DNA polymerase involved in DNA repair|nr:hypothetical protein [Clostridia bacterium]